MIPETENPQESKSVCPGGPARHAQTDPGRYFTQSPHCWFSRYSSHIMIIDVWVRKVFTMAMVVIARNDSCTQFGSSEQGHIQIVLTHRTLGHVQAKLTNQLTAFNQHSQTTRCVRTAIV